MTRRIVARPLTAAAFAPFGQVIEAAGAPDRIINAGRCGRFHDRGTPDVEGRTGISVFRSESVELPYSFELVERHPLGSQAFMPLGADAWLSVVAPDDGGRPGAPRAFLVPAGMGVNLRAGVWHGVLTPLDRPADFLVVDREGEGVNLEEVAIAPVTITA